MPEVRRRQNESFESLLRRFHKKVVLSGRLLQAKKVRFHESDKNKTAKKRSALRRIELQGYYDYLEKMGKLPPTETRGVRR